MAALKLRRNRIQAALQGPFEILSISKVPWEMPHVVTAGCAARSGTRLIHVSAVLYLVLVIAGSPERSICYLVTCFMLCPSCWLLFAA